MKQLLKGFNANSIVIMMASGVLCYMQTRVLQAVDRIPVMEQQLQNFREEMSQIREQLKTESQERKDGDKENQQRIRMVEDRTARQP